MHFYTTILCAGLVSVTIAAYTVQDDYSGNNFFGMFGFDTVGLGVSLSYGTNQRLRRTILPVAT